MLEFSPEQEARAFETAMQARELARAAMLQFLHDHFEELGYGESMLAPAVWAYLLNHDHGTSHPDLIRYAARNKSRIEECGSFLISKDNDFARATGYVVFLEWGWAIAYSMKERAESVMAGGAFALLCRMHPEITRSPETLDPFRALAFFEEWEKKWNKRIKSGS
jgi:hypothetical protein